jgi:hypothetical protein
MFVRKSFGRCAALVAVLGAGCSASTSSSDDAASAPDAGGDDAATFDAGDHDTGADASTPFVSAPHGLPPLLTLHTTKVLAAPQLVTVTFTGFAKQADVEAFGDFVVGSKWLDAVGRDYGVGLGTHVAKARLAETAPAKITDAQIVSLLKARITDGTLPAPSATNDALVFLVYFPQATTVDDGTGTVLCADDYSGYHAIAKSSGTTFGYAVLPDCDGKLDSLTSTASHEIIEAATDPDDAWYLDVPSDDPWSGLQNAEVGDLCEWNDPVREGPWALQRSWSNAAAAAGLNPCIPQGKVTSGAMMGVTAAPPKVVTLKPGASTTFTLTGWSSAPVAGWELHTFITDGADFDPQPMLSTTNVSNGGAVTVTLTVPTKDLHGKAVSSGQMGSTILYSGPDFDLFSPITVVAQ